MKHTLILVLSAVRKPWGAMLEKAMSTWDSIDHPNTTTLYYVGAGGPVGPKVFCSCYDEGLQNIGRRTIEAFEHALTITEWTHLARPHSSCYVHKHRLVEYVNALPDTGVMYGLQTNTPSGAPFLVGCGHYIYSRDVIEKMVQHKHQWDNSIMEDNAVSKLALSIGVQFGRVRTCSIDKQQDGSWLCLVYHGQHPSFTFTDFNDLNKTDQFFFRVKHDPDRSVDLTLMDMLFKHLI